MNITYKSLTAFISVAQTGSFAEASERLFLSQPALSTAIKNMEAQLGGKLFTRSTRKVGLTPEGRSFLPIAKRLIVDWDSAFTDLSKQFSLQTGVLSVSAMPSFAEGILAAKLAEFQVEFPELRVRLLDEVMERVIEHILDKRAELGFIFEPSDVTGLTFTPLFKDAFMLVVPSSHALALKQRVSICDCESYPMVAMNKGSSVRVWLDECFTKHDIAPLISIETSQFGTLGELVSKGAGIAIVPTICASVMRAKSCICLSFEEAYFSKNVGIIEQKRSNLSSAAQQFKNFMLDNLYEQ